MSKAIIGLLVFNVAAAIYVLIVAPTAAPSESMPYMTAIESNVSKLSTTAVGNAGLNVVLDINYQLQKARGSADYAYRAYQRIEVPTVIISLVNIAALATLVVLGRPKGKVEPIPGKDA